MKILEESYARMNQMIMQLEKIEKDAYTVISKEKSEKMLHDIIIFMEANPILLIGGFEKIFI